MHDSARVWTIVELLRWTTDYLKERAFENPRLEVERLLGDTLGVDRVHLYLEFDRPLTGAELAEFKAKLKRRLQHEPLQYILGRSEFWGLELKVNSSVPIPRPETETLVEVCTKLLDERPPSRFLDVGTGCGNIAIALAKEWPSTQGVGIDISPHAIELARENARRLGLRDRLSFEVVDVLQQPWPAEIVGAFDLLVSNPPYVRPSEWGDLQPEIRLHEPRQGLVAEPDGLVFHRRLAELSGEVLRQQGLLAVEVGFDQADEVRKIFQEARLQDIQVWKDLAGKDRVVTALRKTSAGQAAS